MKRENTMPTMETAVKSFKTAMASEQGAFGPFMITSDPAFVEAAGYAGYDFVLLDMEHGPGTFENLQNLDPRRQRGGRLPCGARSRERTSGSTKLWTWVPGSDDPPDRHRRAGEDRRPRGKVLPPAAEARAACPFRRLRRGAGCGVLHAGAGHGGDPSGGGTEGHGTIWMRSSALKA